MVLLELFNSSASVPLLGALLGLLVLFFYSSRNQDQRKEPPGPRPLPLIGNLLSLDFMKPHITLWEVRPLLVLFGPWSLPGGHVIHLIIQLFWLDNDWYFVCFFYQLSKKYGNVFTVYLGPKKVVVLAGYKTVKQALVNHADEFGDRELVPLIHSLSQGNGMLIHTNYYVTDCIWSSQHYYEKLKSNNMSHLI